MLLQLQEREQIQSEHAAMRRILQSHPHEDKPFKADNRDKDGGGGRTSSVKRELDILQALFFFSSSVKHAFIFSSMLDRRCIVLLHASNSMFHRRNGS